MKFKWRLNGVYMEFTWSLHGVYLGMCAGGKGVLHWRPCPSWWTTKSSLDCLICPGAQQRDGAGRGDLGVLGVPIGARAGMELLMGASLSCRESWSFPIGVSHEAQKLNRSLNGV